MSGYDIQQRKREVAIDEEQQEPALPQPQDVAPPQQPVQQQADQGDQNQDVQGDQNQGDQNQGDQNQGDQNQGDQARQEAGNNRGDERPDNEDDTLEPGEEEEEEEVEEPQPGSPQPGSNKTTAAATPGSSQPGPNKTTEVATPGSSQPGSPQPGSPQPGPDATVTPPTTEQQEQPQPGQPQTAFDRIKDSARKLWGKMKGFMLTKEGAGESYDGLEILKGDPEDIKMNLANNPNKKKADLELADVINKDGVSKTDNDAFAKELVDIYRRKQIYKAVVLARTLKNNGGKLGGGRRIAHGADSLYKYGSSAIKAIGSINAASGATNSGWKDSRASNIIGAVTNFMGIVDSLKGIVQKAVKIHSLRTKTDKYRLEGTTDTHKEEIVLNVIGIVSDIHTQLSKAVALAQSIDKLAGSKRGFFDKAAKVMMAVLNSTTQLTGIGTGIYNLFKTKKNFENLKSKENGRWQDAQQQAEAGDAQALEKAQQQAEGEEANQQGAPQAPEQAQQQAEGEEANQQGAPQAPEQAHQQAEAGEANQQRNDIRQKLEKMREKKTMEERRKYANELLGNNVPDEVKDKLVLYIVLCRKIGKTKQDIDMGLANLLSLAVGLASSIVTGKAARKADETEKQTTEGPSGADLINATAGNAGAVMVGAQIGADINARWGKKDERAKLQERLWKHIEPMVDDTAGEYGLKGMSGALGGADEDKKQEARNKANDTVLPAYNAADKYFKDAFVDYDALLKSTSMDEFQRMLVAGI